MKIDESYPGLDRTENKIFTYHLLGCQDHELSINGIGLKETMKPVFNTRPGGNKDFLFLHFYDEVDIEFPGKSLRNIQKKWIILTPGTPHTYGNSQKKWCHAWMHFSGSFVETLLDRYPLPVNSLQNAETFPFFDSMLANLHEEIYYHDFPFIKILKNHLETAFLQSYRAVECSREQVIPEQMLRIRQILDFKYREKISLSDLAEEVPCSEPYLCAKFKKTFGISPTDYLLQRRMNIAGHLLRTTDLRINEISRNVGYDDIYYFSRSFKKRIGSSPSAFRKNQLQ